MKLKTKEGTLTVKKGLFSIHITEESPGGRYEFSCKKRALEALWIPYEEKAVDSEGNTYAYYRILLQVGKCTHSFNLISYKEALRLFNYLK